MPFPGSRSVDNFEMIELIGEGVYGQVFKAKEIATGEIVALKKIFFEDEGVPTSALREIRILTNLNHPNVIKLKEVVTSPDGFEIYLVLEYMEHDLLGLARRGMFPFAIPQIKCYMKQLLKGLGHCHENQVLHLDLKGANILVNNKGILKLADFGLSRPHSPGTCYTSRVITLPHRPLELLFGVTDYGPEVDMWSVGCIFAMLLLAKDLFRPEDVDDQIEQIYELCGVPDETNWPEVVNLPAYDDYKHIDRQQKSKLRDRYKGRLAPDALDLLDKMLTLNPTQRISAQQALQDCYFRKDPLPAEPNSLPEYEPSHVYQVEKERRFLQQQRQAAQHPRPQSSAPLHTAHPQMLNRSNQPIPANLYAGHGSIQPFQHPGHSSNFQGGYHQFMPRGYSEGRGYHPNRYTQGDIPSTSSHGGGASGSDYRRGALNYQQHGPQGSSSSFGANHGNRDQQYGRQQ